MTPVRHPLVLTLLAMMLRASAAGAVEHSVGQGEPYALAGKRIVFTNWIFVRTGQLDWADAQGKSVFAKGVKMGPREAHFRSFLSPHGVRLMAEPAQRLGHPLIPIERPWETRGINAGGLLFDEGKY